MAPVEVALGLPTFIFEAVVTRRGNVGHGVPYIRPSGRALPPSAPSACTSTSYRMLHAGAHSGNRSDGRPPPGLFRENTNLEWMVLASRERKPPVDSIFRAGLRVRSARAVSAPRAATTLCRSPPCRQR